MTTKPLNISFWTNEESKNSLTHRNGVTQEQLDMLKNLKLGDRLILFFNKNRDRDTSPHFNLKVFGGDSAPRRNNDEDSL